MGMGRTMAIGMQGHSKWANGLLLDAAENLTPPQLDADVPGAYGTIRRIFVHMMGAQRSWLRRWQELDPIAPADEANFPTIESIRSAWESLNGETVAYLETLSESDLEQVIHLKFWSGEEDNAPRWQAIVHQAFHQHQHRGELAAVLTTFGHSPGELDVLDYFDTLIS